MSNLAKMSTAIGLAIVAFILNMFILSSQEKPAQFVRASRLIQVGNRIGVSDIEPIPIPGPAAELNRTFIAFTDDGKGQILGTLASRDYQPGDLILRRDLPTAAPALRILGPFRVLSVGDELVQDADSSTYRASADSTVTVAVKVKRDDNGDEFEFDERTRTLLHILDSARGNKSRDSRLRIVSLVLMPKEGASELDFLAEDEELDPEFTDQSDDVSSTIFENDFIATDELGLAADELAIIVPLDNVKIVPALLMRGNKIGFVTPAY